MLYWALIFLLVAIVAGALGFGGIAGASAANAAVALKLLAQDQGRIDILLTDVVMPGMNGRELGEAAIHIRPPLKVLYMSGYPRNAVVHDGRIDHGVDLLQKPISTQVLASRLRGALG